MTTMKDQPTPYQRLLRRRVELTTDFWELLLSGCSREEIDAIFSRRGAPSERDLIEASLREFEAEDLDSLTARILGQTDDAVTARAA